MRLSLSVTPARTAMMKTGGVASGGGADTKVLPDGLLAPDVAALDNMAPWTLGPNWVDNGGSVTRAGGTGQEFVTGPDMSIPAGDIWVAYSIRGATASGCGVQLQGGFQNTPFINRVTAQHVARFASTGHLRARLLSNVNFDGTLEDFQIVDMTSILAQPADIYIAAGQSQIAADQSGGPIDPDYDYWIPRCIYIPGFSSATYGTTVGEPAACVAPIQMTQQSQGVSPATTFARTVEPATPLGRNVMILAAAEGGTRLLGAGAEWDPFATGTGGARLYNDMVSRTQAALALNPGNQLKGLIWGQGESDRSGSFDVDYPPAFTGMLSQLRSDLTAPALPTILIGPEPDDTHPQQALFISTQEKLDQDSGDATALTGVHYVARASGYLSGDGTHPVAEGHRIAGRRAAQRFIAEGYL